MDPIIKSRLLKIHALATRGVGGEMSNAKSALDSLLKKYNLTIDQLLDLQDPKSERIFYNSHKNRLYNKYLNQVISSVLGEYTRRYVEYFGKRSSGKTWLNHLQYL